MQYDADVSGYICVQRADELCVCVGISCQADPKKQCERDQENAELYKSSNQVV
jgi:hypothetical protein